MRVVNRNEQKSGYLDGQSELCQFLLLVILPYTINRLEVLLHFGIDIFHSDWNIDYPFGLCFSYFGAGIPLTGILLHFPIITMFI